MQQQQQKKNKGNSFDAAVLYGLSIRASIIGQIVDTHENIFIKRVEIIIYFE